MPLDARDFLLQAYHLKHLSRAGWCRVGIPDPESVASHSWGVALLVLLLSPPHLNKERMLELALIHDLPEVIVGDITPHDNITKQEKQHREAQAAATLLPPHLLRIWKEYEENQTEEAKFVHMLDKLDMALQAIAYEHQADTREFVSSAKRKIPDTLWSVMFPKV